MRIENRDVKEVGSCNFCSRGEIRPDGKGLIYPYRKVFEIFGNQMIVRICHECLSELRRAK